jgi:hypothetical protein
MGGNMAIKSVPPPADSILARFVQIVQSLDANEQLEVLRFMQFIKHGAAVAQGKLAVSAATVEFLAQEFGVRPQDLLTPRFAEGTERRA